MKVRFSNQNNFSGMFINSSVSRTTNNDPSWVFYGLLHYELLTWYNNLSNSLSSTQNETSGMNKKVRISWLVFPSKIMQNWHTDFSWHHSTNLAEIYKMHDFWSMKGKSFILRLTMAVTMNTAFLPILSEMYYE